MKFEKYDIFEIVNWLLDKENMTHKRLQKYLYFIYSEYLVEVNDSADNIIKTLFHNDFEAWIHGPVSPIVYGVFRGSGMDILALSKKYETKISNEDIKIVEKIYNKYQKYETYELEQKSHEHDPWKKARGNLNSFEICTSPISDSSIYSYYSNLV